MIRRGLSSYAGGRATLNGEEPSSDWLARKPQFKRALGGSQQKSSERVTSSTDKNWFL